MLLNKLTKGVGTDAFICDWRNRKEYKIAEYIYKIQKEAKF